MVENRNGKRREASSPHWGQDYHAPPPVSTLALRAHARIKGGRLNRTDEACQPSRYARARGWGRGHAAAALKKLFPNPNCSNVLNFY